jgi:hypothetical protein
MATVTFDTLKFANTLKAAGVPDDQAEAQARAVAEAMGEVDVATKRDIDDLRKAIRADLLDQKVDMVKWIVGLALAQLALLVGILFTLLRLPH